MATAQGPIRLRSGRWAYFVDGRMSSVMSDDALEDMAEERAEGHDVDSDYFADREADRYEHDALGL